MNVYRNRGWVLAGLLVGILVAALDQTIVDTAFPRMIADLHGEAYFTWVITIYMLASTAIVPVVGKLADIYGPKTFYIAGGTIFVAGSMLCGLSQDMTQLIIFRALQGVGGGMLFPLTFTIVGDLYPGEERAKMQGLFGGMFGLASIMGPKLGGWITTYVGWRWIFYINLPIGIVSGLLMLLFYQESKGERRPIDWLGSVTVTVGIVTFLLAMARGDDWGWASWQTLSLFGAAAGLLALFLWTERRVPEPVLDLGLFKNRTFTVMQIIGFLTGAAMFMALIFIPWFIQGVVGVDPNRAGSVMTPMMMTMVISSILAGRIALKWPYRYQITAGFALMIGGFLLMTGWSVATTQWEATLSSMVFGAGLGQMMPILNLAVQNAFPANRRGVVTSSTTFFRQIGATVGSTVGGVIFNAQMAGQFQQQMAAQMAGLQATLTGLPAEAAEFFRQAVSDPQMLVRVLLSHEAQAAIPEGLRGPFLGGIKAMMAGSLHVVFFTGIGIALAGGLAVQLLGNVSLRNQAKEQAGAPMVAHAPLSE